MVKKRQQDLDVGHLTKKSNQTITTLQDRKKVTKKKNASSQSFNKLKETAKTLLFNYNGSGATLNKRKLLRTAADNKSTTSTISDNPGSSKLTAEHGATETAPHAQRRRTRSCSSPEKLFSLDILSPASRSKRKIKRKSEPLQSDGRKETCNSTSEAPLVATSELAEVGERATPVTAAPSRTHIQQTLKELANQASTKYDKKQHWRHVVPPMQLSHSLKLWSLESNSWLVAFYHRVEIRGFVKLTSLSAEGYLQVHGYSLSSAESVEVISPPGYHNGVLEVSFTSEMPAEIPALEDIERAVGCHSISLPAVYDEVKQYLLQHPESALIHLQQVENPRLGPIMQLLPNVKMGDGFISLGESSYISEHGTEARYSATVHSALDHLVDRHSAGEPLCVVVCGAKNIGKSTLIKYIINKLLKLSKKGVAHLDCDPGQCEFSPPGNLTLHTVTSPLLGPAWYNVPVKVDNSKLYGAMSADIDPDGYLRCVRQLVQQYRSGDTKHLPLLVNTMGWTQGLGLHLLSATVAEVRPTHVIQLCSEGLSYHNFSELSVLNLSSHDMFIPSEISSTMHKFLDYELIPLVMSHIQKLKFESDVLRPILCRDLMTTSYMLKSSRPTSRIVNEITPYRVSMSNIALCFGAEPLPARLWSEAITMQVVVLCSAAPDVVADVEGSAYKTVTVGGAAALSVVGYGLVRAVDDCRQCLYISTPLSPTHLARVNVLYKLHGSITPEMWFFQQVGWVSDGKGLPFVSKRLSGAGFVSTASAKYKFRKSKN